MQNEPLVSILIPVFNRGKIIKQCVLSAINQTYTNTEIIISDNCSNDNTWQELCELKNIYPNINIYKNSTNLGAVKNWFRCLQLANGGFVKFLWSDDIISKYFIEETISLFTEKTGFVITSVRFFNKNISILSETNYTVGKTGTYESELFINNMICGKEQVTVSASCAIFRKEALESSLLIEIPNSYSLDHSIAGAGNDSLKFLISCVIYDEFGYLNKPLAFLSYGYNSISATDGIKLKKYYFTAYYYFVKKYRNELGTKLKAFFKYQLSQIKKTNPEYDNLARIYNDIKYPLKIKELMLVYFFQKKIKFKYLSRKLVHKTLLAIKIKPLQF